jgi:Flp pilus assembly protein TadB
MASTGAPYRHRLPTPGAGEKGAMDTWLIIVIAVVAVLVVAAALWLVSRSRARRLEERRAEAGEHRETSERQALRAREREEAAQDELERAKMEREVAQAHARRADELDPDVEAPDR